MSQRRSAFSASFDPLRVASPKLQVAELAIFTDEEVFNEDGVSFLTFFIVVIALGCCALAGFGLYLRTQQKKDAAVALLTDIGFEMDAPPSKEEVLAMQQLRSSDIERAFDAHDTDHSGGVDKTELLTLLGSCKCSRSLCVFFRRSSEQRLHRRVPARATVRGAVVGDLRHRLQRHA